MKTKWINFVVELELEEISQHLSNHPFSHEIDYGFEVFFIDENRVEASYHEKVSFLEKFTLPDGSIFESEQIKIINFDFKVIKNIKNRFLLEVLSPPRSLKSFIDKFEKSVGVPVFVSLVEINIRKLISYLKENSSVNSLNITNLSVPNVKIDNYNFADIELKSQKNILQSLDATFPNQDFSFKAMKVSFFYNYEKVILKVSNRGSFDSSADTENLISKFLLVQEKD